MPDLFRKILDKTPEQLPAAETLEFKTLKAYAPMKLWANKRRNKRKTGPTKWKPQLNDKVPAYFRRGAGRHREIPAPL
jgi:hypothetical protein